MTDSTTPAAQITAALAAFGVTVTGEVAAQVAARMGADVYNDALKFGALAGLANHHFNALIAEFSAAASAKAATPAERQKEYLTARGFDLSKLSAVKRQELFEHAARILAEKDAGTDNGQAAGLATFQAKGDAATLTDVLTLANAGAATKPVTGERKVTREELPPGPLTPMQKLSAANSLTGPIPKILREIHTKQARLSITPAGVERMQLATYVDGLRMQLRVHGVTA